MSTTLSSNKPLGWHILQPPRQAFGLLSRLRLEWDYCMVHDHGGAFTGSIGYVVADPAAQRVRWLKRCSLLPSGVGVAISGMFTNGHKIANFLHFDFDQVKLSTDTKSFTAQDDAHNLQAELQVKPNNSLTLKGCTHDIEYQLTVQEDWQNRLARSREVFTPVTGRGMGLLPGEQWTVDVIWPRTQVSGIFGT